MRAMRKGLALVVLVACGGGQQQTTSGNVRIEPPDASVAVRPSGPIEPLGVPRGAPFVASFDAAALASIAPLRREIENDLGLPDGSLLQQAGSLGLDTTRPITLACAPLDDEESKLVADLRAEVKDASAMPNDDTIERIASVDTLVVVRALFPTTAGASPSTRSSRATRTRKRTPRSRRARTNRPRRSRARARAPRGTRRRSRASRTSSASRA